MPKTKPTFVIVNVQHGISEDEITAKLSNNNAMTLSEGARITIRATGQTTKLIRVIMESSNQRR